jgi:hypothetical protein
MNIFKAVLFAGMVLASQATAQTFVRFHSGVNLSVAPGGSDRSAAPLDVQEATNAQRVAEAADIGFDSSGSASRWLLGPTPAQPRTSRGG